MWFLKGFDLKEIISVGESALSMTVAVRYVYTKWIWKYLPYRLHGVPLLEGTWEGDFKSTGNTATAANSAQVEVTIYQSDIFSINILRTSAESKSLSMAEDLTVDKNGLVELTYTYRSEPNALVREKSPISYGTCRLSSVSSPVTLLQGDYWTDQKTTGVLLLKKNGKQSPRIAKRH